MWKKVHLLFLLLSFRCESVYAKEKNIDENDPDFVSSSLFEPVERLKRVSPSHYPKPFHLYEDPNVTAIVDPFFGKHRADQDAIFAMAEGYELKYYIAFIKTLGETGFTGDVVFYVSEPAMVKPYVYEYLKYGDHPMNVVVYNPILSCFDNDLNRVKRKKTKNGAMDIFQMCELDNVYGYRDPTTGEVLRGLADLREGRVVATLRYEWYWIWSQFYNPNVWIMLIDSRDTIFQSDPFVDLPRQDLHGIEDGLLYFFGENHEATRLGRSTKNRNWLKNGYGQEVIDMLSEKPTICSGSTMGEQIALDNYLRALINEWDETDIAMTGSDQGFHNYLYYSNKLMYVEQIRKLIVWEQGKGIVNNLGALRTKPLADWGIYDKETHTIFQWDGKTPSPVCHQWDRDEHLHSWLMRIQMKSWAETFRKEYDAKVASGEAPREGSIAAAELK